MKLLELMQISKFIQKIIHQYPLVR